MQCRLIWARLLLCRWGGGGGCDQLSSLCDVLFKSALECRRLRGTTLVCTAVHESSLSRILTDRSEWARGHSINRWLGIPHCPWMDSPRRSQGGCTHKHIWLYGSTGGQKKQQTNKKHNKTATYQLRGHVLLSCGNHYNPRKSSAVLVHQNPPSGSSSTGVWQGLFCMPCFSKFLLSLPLSLSCRVWVILNSSFTYFQFAHIDWLRYKLWLRMQPHHQFITLNHNLKSIFGYTIASDYVPKCWK